MSFWKSLFCRSTSSSSLDRGFLGAPSSRVTETSDFFRFFHLTLCPGLSNSSTQSLLFKPSGSAFQELACVTLKLGERQEILCLELILSRSFVDDPRQGVFAADIAKSFIRGAFGAHATAQIQELADDIEFRARSVAPMLSAGSPRGSHTLARPPSPGFLVYQGATPQIELGSTHAKLRLGNHGVGQESRLVLYAGS